MTHGERLTEYTSEELRVLSFAVCCALNFYDEGNYDGNSKTQDKIEILNQWRSKIIEAITEVRVREINTTEN